MEDNVGDQSSLSQPVNNYGFQGPDSESSAISGESENETGSVEETEHGGYGNVLGDDNRPSKKRKIQVEDNPESQRIRETIQLLLCRYPQLQIRSTNLIMEKLKEYDTEQLKDIYRNAINDVTQLNGMPAPHACITLVTKPIDNKVPGYTQKCLNDNELKKDIEIELVQILGHIGNRANIVFRLINNLYETMRELTFGNTQHVVLNQSNWTAPNLVPPTSYIQTVDLTEINKEKTQNGNSGTVDCAKSKKKGREKKVTWDFDDGESNGSRF